MLSTHRVAYELEYGPIPVGMHVLHRCDNPPCVRPVHLWLGTDMDNVRDAMAKGRKNDKGARNPNAKLNENQVRDIRGRRSSGESAQSISDDLNLHVQTIRKIVRGARWSHVV